MTAARLVSAGSPQEQHNKHNSTHNKDDIKTNKDENPQNYIQYTVVYYIRPHEKLAINLTK